jgi:glucokinase
MRGPIVAVDVGGTKIAAALVGANGDVWQERRVATPEQGLQPLLEHLLRIIDELRALVPAPVRAIGLAVPGVVDAATGTVLMAANLPWRDTPLADIVALHTGLPTVVGNDADGAALAEVWYGSAGASRSVVCLTIGTGVGGGLVIERQLVRGRQRSGFEVGHMIVDPAGPVCRCGSRGCLEVLAAGPAIARRMRAHAGGDWTSEQVIAAARAGDTLASRVLDETAAHLAVAIVNIWRLLAPDVIVLGGGVAAAEDLLLDPLRRHVAKLSPGRAVPPAALRLSTLHRGASVLAAAALVLDAYDQDREALPIAMGGTDTGNLLGSSR